MATEAQIKAVSDAYFAINRTTLNSTVATAIADSIANGTTTLDAYIAGQIAANNTTTSAAVAVAAFITGVAPTSDKLTALKAEAVKQVASYTALGVGNPALGAYEAFGRSFATDASTTAGFNTKYGALSTADFVTAAYFEVYGQAPSAGAAANLTAQVAYFTNLYTTNGVANASLAAKGAVLGQIIGYAFTSDASQLSTLDNKVAAFLTNIAKGDATAYGAALPASSGSADVIITLSNNVDGPNAVSPAVNTNGGAGNDQYLGSFTSADGDFINGGGGNDTLKIVGQGNATVVLQNVERVEQTAVGGAGTVNVAASTGINTLAAVNGTDNATFTGVTGITALDIQNQSAGAVTVTYSPATVAGATDAQTVKINNFGLVGTPAGAINLAGIESVSVEASGVNRFANITSATLNSVTVTGSGSVRADTAFANTVKTFDASASTGNIRAAFAAGADLTVKTGTGNDRIDLAAGLTTKDSVDLGTGTDTLVISTIDVSTAANETLKALNAVKGAEVLEFNGGSSALNNTVLTNSEFTKFVFNTGALDTITNASATATYAFGNTNAGDATFTLAGAGTTLNLALEGVSKTATANIDDANVGALDTGAALTVNLVSSGTTDAVVDFAAGIVAGDFNNVGVVTAQANATFNVSGAANTAIQGFANAVNLQAGNLTGTLVAAGSGGDDVIVAGSAKNFISGGAGIDNIDISKSNAVAGDIIDLAGIVASANRDTVSGFQAGATGDLVRVAAASTTAATAAGTTIAFQEANSNTGNFNFLTGTNDLLELSFNIAGNTLNGVADGTALLAAIGTLTTAAAGATGYVAAYQNGNAYLYHINSGADTAVAAGEINLVGTFNGVAVGGFATSNFVLV